jgi:cyclophilin family peptidyl-prolyl cis-trans isomerase
MPKTANKRAEARRQARVQRAHQEAPERTVRRRVPPARRQARPRGLAGAMQQYPWATTFFFVLLVVIFGFIAHGEQWGPWAKAKPAGVVQATCNLQTHICNKAPLMTIDKSKVYTATLHTTRGDIVIQLDAATAPNAVNNFVFLANQHYYDGTYFWRIEKAGQNSPLTNQPSDLNLIQGGYVTADGKDKAPPAGPPGYTFKDDPISTTAQYTAGTVAMANSGKNTNGAEFFISTGANTDLQTSPAYDIFGTVTSGLNVATTMLPTDKIRSVTINVSNPPPTPTVPAPTSTPQLIAPTATATPKK